MPKMRVRELLDALDKYGDDAPVDFLTAHDLLAKMKGDEAWPRYLDGRFGSYRGYYDELHIGCQRQDAGKNTIGILKTVLRDALKCGVMFGYKGGEYRITGNTPVWLALDSGDCSGLYLSDVQELNGTVIVMLGEETSW